MRIVTLTQIKGGDYNEDTGEYGEVRIPTAINVDRVRCFYPRHQDKPGTRITFDDGGGFAVSESFDQVLAQMNPTVQ